MATFLGFSTLLSAQTTSTSGRKMHQKNDESDSSSTKKHHRTGAIYFSWGYNQEWYTHSTIHILQNSLNNNYDFVSVRGVDHMGWNNKSILKQALTIPQYNYRLGYYFNQKQDWGIELNFDHTKYLVADSQMVHQKGTFGGQQVDRQILFSAKNGFYYFLNNGANFFLFNIVKRLGIYHSPNRDMQLDFVAKAGVGPVIPHVENELFGMPNDMGFQFGGWNTGVETVLRATFKKYGFIEFSQKGDYARYSNLKLADGGDAKQNFGTYELILSIGFIIPTTHHNPLFEKAQTMRDNSENSSEREEKQDREDGN